MANRAAGKGYENEDHYTNIKLQFIGIENIHVMRNSQQKLIDGKQINPHYFYTSRYLSGVDLLSIWKNEPFLSRSWWIRSSLHEWFPVGSGELWVAKTHQSCSRCWSLHCEGNTFLKFLLMVLKGHALLSQVIRKNNENHGNYISNKTWHYLMLESCPKKK